MHQVQSSYIILFIYMYIVYLLKSMLHVQLGGEEPSYCLLRQTYMHMYTMYDHAY